MVVSVIFVCSVTGGFWSYQAPTGGIVLGEEVSLFPFQDPLNIFQVSVWGSRCGAPREPPQARSLYLGCGGVEGHADVCSQPPTVKLGSQYSRNDSSFSIPFQAQRTTLKNTVQYSRQAISVGSETSAEAASGADTSATRLEEASDADVFRTSPAEGMAWSLEGADDAGAEKVGE